MKRLFLLYFALLFSISVLADNKEKVKKIYKTQKIENSSPVIDGRLTEGIWQDAEKSGEFVQFEPESGAAPAEKTEFAILYDDNNIYVGIWAWDTQASEISRRMSRRDNVEGDLVGVDFDSYHDLRTSFGFWVSASGVKMDRIMSGNGDTEDDTWDPIWFVKTHIGSDGWTAEMKIPLSQLRFEKDSKGAWGMNVIRFIFRNEEVSLWSPIPKDASGFVHMFGELHGIEGVEARKQYDFTPYTVASTERYEAEEGNPFATGTDYKYSAGLDAKIGVTNNMILDLSVNPDFGQVEADPSQVNLTAYETFFEEKRPFFIEGRSILSMPLMIGDGDLANENLFYTRRIGRRPHGEPDLDGNEYTTMPSFTRILGAAKLSGKTENGWSIGALETVTRPEKAEIDNEGERRYETIEPLTNYFIGTVGKDLNEGNTVIGGLITATNRKLEDTNLDYLHSSAYTGGLDFTQYLKDRTYMISAKTYFSQVNGSSEALTQTQSSSTHYFQRPDASHLELDSTRTSLMGHGGSMMVGKVGNSPLNFGVFFNWKSPGIELNDVGFIRDSDQLLPIAWGSYQFLEPFSIFRALRFNGSFWSAWDFSGTFMGTGANIGTHMQFTNFWNLSMGMNGQPEQLSTSMLRGGPSFMTPGRLNPYISITTDSRKKLTLSIMGMGSFVNEGHSVTKGGNIDITYRPINNLSITLSPNVMFNESNMQYITETTCMDDPRYIFGAIDQKVMGMSLRLNLNITPEFTIQYWGQPFIATGSYSDFKMVTDPLANEYSDRFHTFSGAEIVHFADEDYCYVDENMDDNPDFYIDYPDFNFKEFKSNLVARWEFRPGSIIYLVWSQGRSGYDTYGDLSFGRDFSDLYNEHPNNVFLVKFSYRFGL